MQDAFVRDMFSISDVNNPRYNGHVQISSCGKGTGGKKDRKGCTKGKIEAIMKNNSVRPKVCAPNSVRKLVNAGNNHSLLSNYNLKKELDEDPYTFTEPEPQTLSLYQPSGSSNKKPPNKTSTNMVCQEKSKVEPGKAVIKVVKTSESVSKMNKLQAEIARSKVVGKRRKIVEAIPPRLLNEWNLKKESGKVCIAAKRKSTWQRERNAKHELLERIHQVKNDLSQYTRDLYPLGLEVSDSDSDSEPDGAVYERSWFSRSNEELPRERRVEETRAALRRRLRHTLTALQLSDTPPKALVSAVIAAARRFPTSTAAILNPSLPTRYTPTINRGAFFLIRGEKCSYPEGCNGQALPSTRHCERHIMYNVDQHLFSHCTAKHTDNTQCTTPVFDVLHHLPLCHVHAASVNEAQSRLSHSESRPGKKVSKKSRVLGSGKRNNKKRKKLLSQSPKWTSLKAVTSPPPPPSSQVGQVSPSASASSGSVQVTLDTGSTSLAPPTGGMSTDFSGEYAVEEVSEEVLAIESLDPVELANQASRLLEEHDITNVLNQLSTDAFNDLFIGVDLDKNGEYEPTREETEELERALEAVNNDVRSLESLSRSLPLLQLPYDTISLLEDTTSTSSSATPAATPTPTAAFPPSYHNGFPPPHTTPHHSHS